MHYQLICTGAVTRLSSKAWATATQTVLGAYRTGDSNRDSQELTEMQE